MSLAVQDGGDVPGLISIQFGLRFLNRTCQSVHDYGQWLRPNNSDAKSRWMR
jgi:hypothetical protein